MKPKYNVRAGLNSTSSNWMSVRSNAGHSAEGNIPKLCLFDHVLMDEVCDCYTVATCELSSMSNKTTPKHDQATRGVINRDPNRVQGEGHLGHAPAATQSES